MSVTIVQSRSMSRSMSTSISMNVCILSYNHPDITARTVQSVIDLGVRNPLLIHNGSTAKNIELLRSRFPQIEHSILEENCGYSGGVNHGLKVALNTHPWTLFLSNDCELIKIGDLPKIPSVIAPTIHRRKLALIDSTGGGFQPSRGKLIHFRSSSDFTAARKNGFIPYLPGSAFLIHREVFESVGGMDTSLGTYWDDVDWSVRALKMGYPVVHDESYRVLHRVGKTCHKNPLYSIYYFQRNRKRVSWKYCPAHLKPILGWSLAREWVRLGTRLALKGRFQDLEHLKNAILD